VPQLTATSGYTAGPDCYVDNPDTISESGGYLNLSVVQVAPFTCDSPDGNFVTDNEAGMVSTSGLFSQTYGVFEVNAKLPAATVAGLQETFWLYPQKLTYGPWPSSGEIDFAEFYSIVNDLDIPYVHYNYSPLDLHDTAYTCGLNTATFNTYEVDWTPTFIAVAYNGNLCMVDHVLGGPAPFNQPFIISLTQALGLGLDPFVQGVTPLPATTQVDWVRAWSPS
jgi:beta-glucanase (GH16 family)